MSAPVRTHPPAECQKLLIQAWPDRNEKPFKCGHCDSRFSRKDVIRRHHLRYHPNIPIVASLRNVHVPEQAVMGAASETRQPNSSTQLSLEAHFGDESVVRSFEE